MHICESRRQSPTLTQQPSDRVWLKTQDQLVASSMGRPTGIKLHEFDVAPLSADDFEVINRPALLFMELARLATILGRIQDLHSRRAGDIHKEVSELWPSCPYPFGCHISWSPSTDPDQELSHYRVAATMVGKSAS